MNENKYLCSCYQYIKTIFVCVCYIVSFCICYGLSKALWSLLVLTCFIAKCGLPCISFSPTPGFINLRITAYWLEEEMGSFLLNLSDSSAVIAFELLFWCRTLASTWYLYPMGEWLFIISVLIVWWLRSWALNQTLCIWILLLTFNSNMILGNSFLCISC